MVLHLFCVVHTQRCLSQAYVGHEDFGALGQAVSKVSEMRAHKVNQVAGRQHRPPVFGCFV